MARIKIQFNEDHIKLIKNLRFGQLEPKFYVTPSHEDVEVRNLGQGHYNINTNLRNEGNKIIAVTTAPLEIRSAADFGDNLYGVDTYNLWGGTFIYEDMAYILGKMDKVVPGTMEDPDGPKFDEETTQYLDELASFIIDNLEKIEQILHQFCTEGIQPGVVYSCKANEGIWEKKDEE